VCARGSKSGRRRRARGALFDSSAAYASAGPSPFTISRRESVIDVANALLTLAQVAIGLAGFSAILVALSGKPHQWTPVDAFRIRNILAFSFQSVFLSLVPFVLAFFRLPESTVWKVSLLIIAIATWGGVLLVLTGVYRLSRPERAVLKAVVVSTVTVILFIMAAVELLAAFGIVRPAPGVFFLGLVVLLGVSTVLVARFLFARPAD
jgi:hypothetical protein